jgi:hypothetical protein
MTELVDGGGIVHLAEIGDQDRGHNLLLGIENSRLTAALRRQVARLAGWNPIPLVLRLGLNLSVGGAGTRLYFYPRLLTYPVERSIARLTAGDRVRGAISHLKPGELTRQLARAVGRGVDVELLVHDTERRVPSELLDQMTREGVRITRVSHAEDLPMHAKFLLIEHAGKCAAWVGSYNFNNRSRRRNAEVLLRTDDRSVFGSLERRFAEIASMATPVGGI